ncbi:MAG: 23S rRNA (pseudouridine(1915)-N(3))-methyltransferase RlmH [Gemmatimonadaceae bacterium]
MKFLVIAVGRPRDKTLAAAIADYETRAARYWPLEFMDVREESGREDPTFVRAREGARLLDRIGSARLVVCDARGDIFDSPGFAEFLQRAREAARDMAFVIGGAFGVDTPVAGAAERRLALAPWTLPHELARLVLAEQLYRAGTIVRREPYHK